MNWNHRITANANAPPRELTVGYMTTTVLLRHEHAEPALRDAGDAALRAIAELPLYARADFVRKDDGAGFWLMELELNRPSISARTPERQFGSPIVFIRP